MEIYKKLILQKYISPPNVVHSYKALEDVKQEDKLRIEFGYNQDQLNLAVYEYELAKDETIKKIEAIALKGRDIDEKKFTESCMPTEEKKAEMLKKVTALGKPQFKADETLTF